MVTLYGEVLRWGCCLWGKWPMVWVHWILLMVVIAMGNVLYPAGVCLVGAGCCFNHLRENVCLGLQFDQCPSGAYVKSNVLGGFCHVPISGAACWEPEQVLLLGARVSLGYSISLLVWAWNQPHMVEVRVCPGILGSGGSGEKAMKCPSDKIWRKSVYKPLWGKNGFLHAELCL